MIDSVTVLVVYETDVVNSKEDAGEVSARVDDALSSTGQTVV